MDYVTFNLAEGLFWIVLGLLSAILSKKLPVAFERLSIFSACTLVLFGTSDFVESQVGSFFEPGLMWLLVWKVFGVIGLVVTVLWYLWIRLRTDRLAKK
jgi:hypothetical protein